MFDELLASLEEVTASLLERSRARDGAGDLEAPSDVEAPIRKREALIGRLAAEMRSGKVLSDAQFERLNRVHREGEHIKLNLVEARARVADQISRGARERMLADRIASQIPNARAPKANG